jgi:hypothetical protein
LRQLPVRAFQKVVGCRSHYVQEEGRGITPEVAKIGMLSRKFDSGRKEKSEQQDGPPPAMQQRTSISAIFASDVFMTL